MKQTHREQYAAAHKAADARRKAARQQKLGIFPLWKAAAVIDAAMRQGYTFEDAHGALMDVIQAQGLRIRADVR